MGFMLLCICWLWVTPEQIQAQNRTITGKVITSDNNAPLQGVRIIAKGTKTGTLSNNKGEFSLSIPDNVTALIFSYIGFTIKEVALSGQTNLTVSLDLDVKALEEVVVTALGVERSKKSLGYAVQEVNAAEITRTNETNVVSALQGKVAGVTITGSGGSPGAGANILIRGVTSLSPGRDNQPLFIIDGIIISNLTQAGNVLPSAGTNSVAGSGEQFAFTNRAADVNPDDIESINILKGPAATALYGLRAANGAVIITTKKGSGGKTTINFSSSIGFDNIAKVPKLQTLFGQGSLGITRAPYSGSAFQSNGPPRSMTGEQFYDPFAMFETGMRYNNSVNISGGNETANFYTSLSRFDQSGTVPYTDFAKTTAALKGSVSLSDNFRVNASINFVNSNSSRPRGGDKSIFSSLSYWSPSFDILDFEFPDGSPKNYTAGIVDQPLWFAKYSRYTDNMNRIFGDLGFSYNPVSWLTLKYQATIDTYSDQRTSYVPGNLDVGTQVRGFVTEDRLFYREMNSNLFLTGNFTLSDDLDLTVLLGNNINEIRRDNLNSRGEGLVIDKFYDLSNATNFFTSRSQGLIRRASIFANAQLTWKEMLYITLSGRNDWSSTLPAENRSFFYPSASVSFVLSELLKESMGTDVLSFARLRASVAGVGKDVEEYSIGEYYVAATGFPFNNVAGFRVDPFAGSLNLRPEKTTGIEIGAELKFFNNRLSLDANYFIQTSEDQLFQIPVSNATGYARFTQNGGKIETNGIELLLSGTPIEMDGFSWDVTINWSTVKGKVLTMPDGITEISFGGDPAGTVFNRVVEGGAVGDLWGYDFVKDSQGRFVINQTTGLPTFKDSLQFVGNAFPDWQGGITNTFTWNGLSLSFLLEWRNGGKAVDMVERNSYRNGILEFTQLRYKQVVFNGVDASGNPNTVPAYIDHNFYRTTPNITHYFNIQDASWFRLRNVQLSYSLPKTLLEGSFLKSVRLNLSGSNLWINTPFRGFDPDALSNGSGTNSYGLVGRNSPAVRNVSFGVNFGF